ncbi:charged multivesicular body protein 6-A-like isoform X2 [Antedon mediterranea]|uniref:charged multivesicular body protein 6-A-like isoform X2 n=1 Tax=Antedon mediterranea TaxID=105859 RepID=UPI003AF8EF75
MGNLFGRKKQPATRITEQDKAVLQLKQQRDKLKQYQRKIEQNLEKERSVAKQLLKNGKKDKAIVLLKKKRYQEQLLKNTDGQLENLEKMVDEIEFAQIEMKVVEGLKVGNESLKKMHEIMSLEDVEKIMDETREGIEYQNEIDSLLSGGLTDEDEEAILEELNEITAAEEAASVPVLPKVPTDELPEIEREKKREKNRQAEMVPAS